MTCPVVFVSGLSRCGTSLMMQMLSAAGLPCAGSFPDFEVDAVSSGPVSRDFMQAHAGHAAKRLDPQRAPTPAGAPFVSIWLDRDPLEQARSQVKFLHLMGGEPLPNRAQLRRWAAGLRRDRGDAVRAIAGQPMIVVRFEDLVTIPLPTAQRVAGWLSPWLTVDAQRMAAAALPRPAACQPAMEIEMQLVGRTAA